MGFRRKWFDIALRLSVLLLPWQTRWFAEGIPLNGFPWEQGRWAVYGVWFFMAAMIILSERSVWLRGERRSPLRGWGGVGLVGLASVLTISGRATGQWWIQVGILSVWAFVLVRSKIPFRRLLSWFVASMILPMVIGFLQATEQIVHASKWLGMAAQNPQMPGVIVIEVAGERILRAYGNFPHPNIIGAWLVFAILACVVLAAMEERRFRRAVWSAFGAAMSVVLVLTFARAAWIALGVGIVGLVSLAAKKRGIVAVGLIVLAFGLTVAVEHRAVFVRVAPMSRLEQRSVNERMQSMSDGWRLFRAHPWFGTGLGTVGLALTRDPVWQSRGSVSPPVPPHLIPLLILDEVGLIGAIGLLLILWNLVLKIRERKNVLCYLSLILLFVLSLFDHFLWSLWSGQTLVAVAVIFCLSEYN